MKRFILTFLVALVCGISMFAQQATIKGRVVDANSTDVIPAVVVSVEKSVFTTQTDAEGRFSISNAELPQGEQVLLLSKEGYLSKRIPVTIQNGQTLDLDPLLLDIDLAAIEAQIGIISLSDNELNEDEGTSFSVSGLLQASRDVFLNAAAFDFSATFFRPRGYDSENGTVLINGIKMNKIYDGRPQWADWGGLNDVQRNQEFSMSTTANEYTFGDLGGTTNMVMRASQYRKGGRVSYATSNRSYQGRVMGSYSSGQLQNGWAYTVLAARRFGQEGFNDGTLYDANSFFLSVEKQLSKNHSLNFTGFYTPNRRGKSSPNTQEVIDLKGIEYNPFWGEQDGEIRNSRIKEVKEPIVMLNHYWDVSKKTQLNTNVAYQFGSIGNSRLGYDNAPNPDPTYYQYLPSFFLGNPDGPDLAGAYSAYDKFNRDGQIDWNNLYETNILFGGTSRYYLYEDRNDDNQLMANTNLTSKLNQNVSINAALNYRTLNSKNFANLIDVLGGNGYLDIDTFNQGDAQQNDLNNPNRIVGNGDTFKYNYEIDAEEYYGFAQAQFTYNKVDFYVAANGGKTEYQRNGLYRSGSFADNSFGQSKNLDFTTYGIKGGATYKLSGRNFFDANVAYFTNAPTVRNSFSNSRQNNNTVDGLTEEISTHFDASYIYRSSFIKGRLTGYYTKTEDATEISFYYADGISSTARNVSNAFVQEVLTGIDKRFIGAELGFEAQVTPTIKLKAAGSYGQYTYENNPNLYLTSDDRISDGANGGDEFRLDLGKAFLKDYKISGGPQQAYQLGFEYRDPDFWSFGLTTNYFNSAYIDIAPITRTRNFGLDSNQELFNDYDPAIARELLRQEKFDDYVLVNVIGGKSWKVDDYFIGFFATINNVFDKRYKTGGFEQSRTANYRELVEDSSKETRVFGPKYFYGFGATYYLNLYVRF